MSIPAGARLGPYEIVAILGAGGMGEVYRATDTRLKRQVALKVLPPALAADADRLARFQREAEVLASLNHPNIAHLHGLEDADGVTALVIELVEGEDLAERLSRGPIPIDEALPIARQIADALEAAHGQGIVHRDLKPANIKVRSDGTVKVLDFGLAKMMDPGTGGRQAADVSASPTITTPAMTQAGMILGTAAYMSPEQAKGRPADKRSDIWGFGCVLFEMLTGRRPFVGEDVSDTLAAILRADPEWTELPQGLPAPVDALVKGCLKKDRRLRIADIAVAQFLLNQPAMPAADVTASPGAAGSTRGWQTGAAVLVVTTLGALGMTVWPRARPVVEVTQFLVTPPEKGAFVTAGRTGTSVAISPDGRRLAYTARDETGRIFIWLRPLNGLTAQPLPGTDNAEFPFWSPDSHSLAYFANGKLLRVDAGGGPAQIICDADGARGGTWGSGGVIVFGGGTGRGLSRVAASGGAPVELTKVETGDHRFPSFLPDGRHVLFYRFIQGSSSETAGVYVVALDSGAPKRLAAADTAAVYASEGLVLFGRQGTLLAQPLDLGTLSLTGEPTPVAEKVESGVFGGVLAFSVSNNGTLAYGIGTGREAALQLTWFDRQGKVLGTLGQPANYFGIDLSPDDKQVVAHRHDSGVGGDLWLIDIARGTTSRFTFDPAQDNSSPVWSPDGRRIAFASLRNRAFGLFIKSANGAAAEEPVEQPLLTVAPRSWSPDGKLLLYASNQSTTRSDAWMLPLEGDRKPIPVLTTPFAEQSPQISPDGKWLAYSSDESGTFEVYVRPFPKGEGKYQVSTAGGVELRWRGDSKELFYVDRQQLGSLMAVDVGGTGEALSAGVPHRLFDFAMLVGAHPGAQGLPLFDVSQDGQRFLVPTNRRATTFADSVSAPIAVVVNWAAGLRK